MTNAERVALIRKVCGLLETDTATVVDTLWLSDHETVYDALASLAGELEAEGDGVIAEGKIVGADLTFKGEVTITIETQCSSVQLGKYVHVIETTPPSDVAKGAQ